MMLRMRQQLNQVLGRLPGNANSTEIDGLPELPFGNIDLSKANTTSTVKVRFFFIFVYSIINIDALMVRAAAKFSRNYYYVRLIHRHHETVI